MEVIFLRHGESEANAQGIIQGRGDYHLSARGREQALEAAHALRDFHPYRIYSSPLARARETAEIINRPHNTEIVVLEDLIEYFLGEFEGLAGEELISRYPDLPQKIKNGVPFHHLAHGAETDAAAAQRAQRALHEILDSGLPRVIVVSHLGILEQIMRHVFQSPTFIAPGIALHAPLLNCAITWIEFQPAATRLLKFNDVSHLQ